jgi:hypothetical protein
MLLLFQLANTQNTQNTQRETTFSRVEITDKGLLLPVDSGPNSELTNFVKEGNSAQLPCTVNTIWDSSQSDSVKMTTSFSSCVDNILPNNLTILDIVDVTENKYDLHGNELNENDENDENDTTTERKQLVLTYYVQPCLQIQIQLYWNGHTTPYYVYPHVFCKDCYNTNNVTTPNRYKIANHASTTNCNGMTCTCYDGDFTCTGCRRRPAYQKMTMPARERFMKTVNLALEKDKDKMNALMALHATESGQGHGSWHRGFGQWHELYLFRWEELLRENTLDKCIVLPYFAHHLDSSSTSTSFSFWDAYLGDPTIGNDFGIYGDGSGGISSTPNPGSTSGQCRSSTFTYTSVPTAADATTLLSDSNLGTFIASLEGNYHVDGHIQLGGGGCWMGSVPTASYDPIFYMHHAFVDRLWCMWKKRYPAEWNAWLVASGPDILSNGLGNYDTATKSWDTSVTWSQSESIINYDANYNGNSVCPCSYGPMYSIIKVPFDLILRDLSLFMLDDFTNTRTRALALTNKDVQNCIRTHVPTNDESVWFWNADDDTLNEYAFTKCTHDYFNDYSENGVEGIVSLDQNFDDRLNMTTNTRKPPTVGQVMKSLELTHVKSSFTGFSRQDFENAFESHNSVTCKRLIDAYREPCSTNQESALPATNAFII